MADYGLGQWYLPLQELLSEALRTGLLGTFEVGEQDVARERCECRVRLLRHVVEFYLRGVLVEAVAGVVCVDALARLVVGVVVAGATLFVVRRVVSAALAVTQYYGQSVAAYRH